MISADKHCQVWVKCVTIKIVIADVCVNAAISSTDRLRGVSGQVNELASAFEVNS
jgi:hypothetical protein